MTKHTHSHQGRGELEPIPACTGWEMRHTHTYGQFSIFNRPTCMSLDSGREYTWTQEEHANSIRGAPRPGFEPRTLLLWGDSDTHRTKPHTVINILKSWTLTLEVPVVQKTRWQDLRNCPRLKGWCRDDYYRDKVGQWITLAWTDHADQ